MHLFVILQLLFLLVVANGTPVLVKRVWNHRFAYPLDGGIRFFDGEPLLGRSKTVRGIVSSVLVTSACAPLVGLDWTIGAVVGSAAMLGDLFSSFLKRRLRLPPSSRATGLDQVPEALFPLLVCRSLLALSVADIAVGVLLFFVGGVILSRVLYQLRIRQHPH